MLHTKRKYTSPYVSYGAAIAKTRVIPDQSMSIHEIVRRYVKGIPVDVTQRQPIYIDQGEHDLEKISRMDFGEKAEMAQQLAAEAEALKEQFQADVANAHAAKKARIAEKKAKAEQAASTKHSQSLDNTMLRDTNLKDS